MKTRAANTDLTISRHMSICVISSFSYTLYFKVSFLKCNYIFKYWVILINYMYLLLGLGLGFDSGLLACNYE